MTYRGHVQNGNIILDEPATLPEGTEVTVSANILATPSAPEPRRWMGRYKGTAKVPDLEEFQQVRDNLWSAK